jgi:hypothetical protein
VPEDLVLFTISRQACVQALAILLTGPHAQIGQQPLPDGVRSISLRQRWSDKNDHVLWAA